MGGTASSAQSTLIWKQIPSIDLPTLFLSITLQLVLGLFLGHYYDTRIFMASGYLVGTGQNPYNTQNLSVIFNNSSFQGMTSIGYPPPWPILLGLLYRVVYAIYPNLLVYNLAIKIPIIISNFGVAYLVAGILKNLGSDSTIIHKSWIFLLFNPFILYFSSGWGQFDSIVAFLSLLSLVLLNVGILKSSAVLLALAISSKPIALPILPVVLIYLIGKSFHKALVYSVMFLVSLIFFCIIPFFLFSWDPIPIFQGWNAQFTMAGGITYLTFFELLKDTYKLPGDWWLLGLVWIPALAIGIFALKRKVVGFTDLLKGSSAMIMLFFLTRAWLSEPNVILILPFLLILASIGELKTFAFTVVWVLPLVFTIFNTSPPQLLFLSFPDTMTGILRLVDNYRVIRLIARIVVVIPWEIAGWWIVLTCFRRAHPSVV